MAFYEAGVIGAAPGTADNAISALWNTSSTMALRLREIGYNQVGSTNAEKVAPKRLSARGTINGANTMLGNPLDPNDPVALGTVDYSWTVQPTVTGNYLRRTQQIISQGSGLFWMWYVGAGLLVPPSAGVALVVPTSSASDQAETYWVWEEA